MNNHHFHIGIPTILMVLFSLCLFVFSMLSFVSAYSDYKLSCKIIERTNSYYNACNHMQDTLFEFSNTLTDIVSHSSNSSDYQSQLSCLTFSFDEPLNADQTLHVEVVPHDPFSDHSKDLFHISCWKVILSDENNYDEHLHVIP